MRIKNVRDIAATARDRRKYLGWSQSQLAVKAGVGRDWVVQFEKGKATAEWGLVMRVLRELSLSMELSAEEADASKSDLDRVLALTTNKRG